MRILLGLIAIAAFSTPASAADWWEAETDHFIVYSQSSDQQAAEMAVKLERFDEALRFLQAMKEDEAPLERSAKLTLYHFGSTADIGRLAGSSGVAGFFIPRAGNSVAFTPRKAASISSRGQSIHRGQGSTDPQIVLFHEYAHYFMFQHAPAAYPAWYVEGTAEVYGTLVLRDDGFRLGEPAEHRAFVLDYFSNYPVSRMLDPPEEMDWEDSIQMYSLGWMTCHYLTFSGERPGQLGTYLNLINQGKTSLQAAQEAFGDLEELDRELDRYRTAKTPVIDIAHADYTMPVARLRKLAPGEQAMMDIHIKSQRGITRKDAASLVDGARKLKARFPDSVPVLLSVATAEFDAENTAQALDAAQRALQLDASSAQANILLGKIAMRKALDDPSQYLVARTFFAAANRIENTNPVALQGYYNSFFKAGEKPPEEALSALETAYHMARFDKVLSIQLARLFLDESRETDTITLLSPFANSPHPDDTTKLIREAVDLIEAGNSGEAAAKLAEAEMSAENEAGEGGDGDDGDDGDDDGKADLRQAIAKSDLDGTD